MPPTVGEASIREADRESEKTCLYCKDSWVAKAPKNDEHIQVVQTIQPGTVFEFYCW